MQKAEEGKQLPSSPGPVLPQSLWSSCWPFSSLSCVGGTPWYTGQRLGWLAPEEGDKGSFGGWVSP